MTATLGTAVIPTAWLGFSALLSVSDSARNPLLTLGKGTSGLVAADAGSRGRPAAGNPIGKSPAWLLIHVRSWQCEPEYPGHASILPRFANSLRAQLSATRSCPEQSTQLDCDAPMTVAGTP